MLPLVLAGGAHGARGVGVKLGAWSLELGAWSLELGAWSLELGAWSLELGAWSLELGAWSLASFRMSRLSSFSSS
ncbi:hypothetical protein Ga0100231_020200 [Opitutaceae bacterium TAV4]|nr:hypothetical protein Ga0100231_020200 [Opitutaceae bacterium TAV4]